MNKKTVYCASLLTGLFAAVVIYGVMFDSMSETVLVQITPLWFFPLVFGLYGFLTEKAVAMIEAGRAESVGQAVVIWGRSFGVLGLIPVLPFAVLRGKETLRVAAAAAAMWAALLWLFFAVVFPSL